MEIGYIDITFSDTAHVNVPLWVLITIGYVINISVIGFIFLISYWDGFYNFMYGPIGKLLNKLRIMKDLDDYRRRIEGARDNFRNNLKHMFSNVPVILICLAAFFAYITISYSVPYFAGLALNNQSQYANFWDSVLLSNFHQMVTCIIPIPGNSVVSELFFLRLFYPDNTVVKFYESEELAKAALLLWRSLMFIFPLFISCLYTVIYRPRKRKNATNQESQIPEE